MEEELTFDTGCHTLSSVFELHADFPGAGDTPLSIPFSTLALHSQSIRRRLSTSRSGATRPTRLIIDIHTPCFPLQIRIPTLGTAMRPRQI